MKKKYWYVVYWRNKLFFRTHYKPMKVGSIIGYDTRPEDSCRSGYHEKTNHFGIVEKYKFLFRGTFNEFKKWIKEGD